MTNDAPMEWQPIETAPRDGLLIIIFAITDTETGNWQQRISWWSEAHGGKWMDWPGYAPPTHWMPLPPPPRTKGRDE